MVGSFVEYFLPARILHLWVGGEEMRYSLEIGGENVSEYLVWRSATVGTM